MTFAKNMIELRLQSKERFETKETLALFLLPAFEKNVNVKVFDHEFIFRLGSTLYGPLEKLAVKNDSVTTS